MSMAPDRVPHVQEFDVLSEGPVLPWLKLMANDGQISHYAFAPPGTVHVYNEPPSTVERLVLYWSQPSATVGALPLIGTTRQRKNDHSIWVGPTVEHVAGMVEAWLATVERGDRPRTDGSTDRGWRICNIGCHQYDHLFVEPHWQVYGK